jgi:hypothetical protein
MNQRVEYADDPEHGVTPSDTRSPSASVVPGTIGNRSHVPVVPGSLPCKGNRTTGTKFRDGNQSKGDAWSSLPSPPGSVEAAARVQARIAAGERLGRGGRR